MNDRLAGYVSAISLNKLERHSWSTDRPRRRETRKRFSTDLGGESWRGSFLSRRPRPRGIGGQEHDRDGIVRQWLLH